VCLGLLISELRCIDCACPGIESKAWKTVVHEIQSKVVTDTHNIDHGRTEVAPPIPAAADLAQFAHHRAARVCIAPELLSKDDSANPRRQHRLIRPGAPTSMPTWMT
jgi:hypothetical protein